MRWKIIETTGGKERNLMKFFIPVYPSTLVDDGPQRWGLGSDPEDIHGPFKDDKAVEEEIRQNWPKSQQNLFFMVFEGNILNIKPQGEKPESEKREPGNMKNYQQKPTGNFTGALVCIDCGADILYGMVATSKVKYEKSVAYQTKQVPYCPNCEKIPTFTCSD